MEILWIVAVVLIGLWVVGLVTKVAGGVVHILLLIALVVILYNVFNGMGATT